MKRYLVTACLLYFFCFHTSLFAQGVSNADNQVRIKDLARFQGVRSNSLMGYGLVVGLNGTGDSNSSLATTKATSLMISRLGTIVTQDKVLTKNIAAVLVTAELPPFAKIGDKITVRVSSIGDAKSLAGGTLVLTPLKGANDEIYATAQGNISIGLALTGASGGSTQGQDTNAAFKTVALTDGGIVEKEFSSQFLQRGNLLLSLRQDDFTTASRMAQAINSYYGAMLATALNSRQVQVNVPADVFNNPSFNLVDFVASVEQIKLTPDQLAKIVMNERTGTIIIGSNVTLSAVAISHGFLEISIEENKTNIANLKRSSVTLGDLVQSLNTLGVGPKDLVAIVQALAKAGALNAELVFL